MELIVCFLAGALASAAALGIWYYAYIVQLRKERQAVREEGERLSQRVQNERQGVQKEAERLSQQMSELASGKQRLAQDIAAFDERHVRYDDLQKENNGLKQDLFNLSVQLRKMERDQDSLASNQQAVDQRSHQLAQRYLEESVSWVGDKLTTKNFASSKERLLKAIQACRAIGFQISSEREQQLVESLKRGYEQAVRDEFAREEQARIKAQIREEEKLAREVEKQIQDAQREQAAIQVALQKALKEATDAHSAEVEHLRIKLQEAEERTARAMSQAQLTKAGHVYVLSNIGSFGEGVFKIGMTRRLEPMDRVRELGDASVPFPFDVHMMISCNDAPALENTLHREMHKRRLNKVNFRKEFFRVDLGAICRVVEANHGTVEYVAEPAALEYRESAKMGDTDYAFVEQTLEAVMGDGERGED